MNSRSRPALLLFSHAAVILLVWPDSDPDPDKLFPSLLHELSLLVRADPYPSGIFQGPQAIQDGKHRRRLICFFCTTSCAMPFAFEARVDVILPC